MNKLPVVFLSISQDEHIWYLCIINSSSQSRIGPPETPVHPGRPTKKVSPQHTAQPQNKRHSLTTLSQHVQQPTLAVHRRSLDSTTAETDLLAVGGQITSSSGDTSLPFPLVPLSVNTKKSDIGKRLCEVSLT